GAQGADRSHRGLGAARARGHQEEIDVSPRVEAAGTAEVGEARARRHGLGIVEWEGDHSGHPEPHGGRGGGRAAGTVAAQRDLGTRAKAQRLRELAIDDERRLLPAARPEIASLEEDPRPADPATVALPRRRETTSSTSGSARMAAPAASASAMRGRAKAGASAAITR